jgi:hypothetical protein
MVAAIELAPRHPRPVGGMTGPCDLALWEDVAAEEQCSADGSKTGRKGSATS